MTQVTHQILSLIEALCSVIWVRHEHYPEVEEILEEIRKDLQIPIYTFDLALGLVSAGGSGGQPRDALEVLRVAEMEGRCLVVLRDAHAVLKDERVVAMVRHLAERTLQGVESFGVTVVMLSPRGQIPVELEHLTTVFELPQPRDEDLRGMVKAFAAEQEISVDSQTEDMMVVACRGLRRLEVLQILRKAYQLHGKLNQEARQVIQAEKEQVLRKSGKLELIEATESTDDLGGLEDLKAWLRRKKKVFERLDRAILRGVDPPRGILMVGLPGCGKSVAAKATAKEFGVPLLRLDIGRLLGKYVGESEENLSLALRLAEDVSPCVLWIDELEKAFSGVGQEDGGGSVVSRLFGHFLTWMQEKKRPVFVVATANNIDRLPREFSRKGRFDEVFSVDLPGREERQSILEIHLRKRKCNLRKLEINPLIDLTDNFNGADLEALVKESVERAFLEDREVRTEDLQDSARGMIEFVASAKRKKENEKLREQLKELEVRSAGKVR